MPSSLPPDQLAEVLADENRRNLAIAGTIDLPGQTLAVWRGDLSRIVFPLSAFEGTSDRVEPDFSRFSIADWGQTLCFGEYEAAFDSLLYEFDPEYRRELKKKRRIEEQGFGPSLRRLRLQKRMSREDFAPVSAKTIARLERGEATPRGGTLEAIARKLGVAPHEIESF